LSKWAVRFLFTYKGTMMSTVLMGLQVLPKVENAEVYAVVDEAIAVIASSGAKYEVGAFETVLEGELDDLWQIARQAIAVCMEKGADSLLVNIRLHVRKDDVTLAEKIGKYRQEKMGAKP